MTLKIEVAKMHRCLICDEIGIRPFVTLTIESVVRHSYLNHRLCSKMDGTEVSECGFCRSEFTGMDYEKPEEIAKRHVREACCGNKKKSSRNLDENDFVKTYQCRLCSAIGNSERAIVEHSWQSHISHDSGMLVRTFICGLCKREFTESFRDSYETSIEKHLIEAHTELSDPVQDRPNWDTYFLNLALAVSERADCRRRKVGCVIVDSEHRIVSTGYNGAPAGEEGCLSGACPRGLLSYKEVQASTNYDEGPGKCISLHAEANALLYAGRMVRGCTAYVTAEPCPTCAKLLKGAGISRTVVSPKTRSSV